MLIIKNAQVYAPENLGLRDVLIEGSKIVKIAESIGITAEGLIDVIDLGGKRLIPGLVDNHVHITGGGGEAGPASRVPESNLSDFIQAGVTTVLGLLGTDGISRSLENLYAKAQALTEEGISCYMLTGSYAYPPVTITGSVEKDIYLLEHCIGVKIAVSDHRGSGVTAQELIRLASEARRGGMISGKAGIVTIHMGSGKKGLKPILEAIEKSDLPMKTLVPTHVNSREPELLEECAAFATLGGSMDFTAEATFDENVREAKKLLKLLDQGVDPTRIAISSDAFGSQPRFDEEGNTIGLTYLTSEVLLSFLKALVSEGLPLEKALPFFTVNPARIMGLEGKKGALQEGADADLVALDEEMNITDVFAKGRVAMRDGALIMKGRFEL